MDWHPVFPSILATGRAAKNPFPGDVKIWDLKEKTGSGDISPIGRLFTADGVGPSSFGDCVDMQCRVSECVGMHRRGLSSKCGAAH